MKSTYCAKLSSTGKETKNRRTRCFNRKVYIYIQFCFIRVSQNLEKKEREGGGKKERSYEFAGAKGKYAIIVSMIIIAVPESRIV